MTTLDLQADGESALTWRRYKFPRAHLRFATLLLVLAFIGYSFHYLNVDLARLLSMFGRIGNLLAERYYPPEVDYVLAGNYLASVVETMQMAFLGALAGIALAMPLAWLAARNVTPSRWLFFPLARLAIMACRSVHEMIWAILFVTIIGFGTFPGVLALTMFCIGFAGKLFAEEIEAIDMGPVEAIRAVGGNHVQVLLFAVIPQVKLAWTGISIYTWDVAFRAATVVGFFGGGGMGWYLKQAVQQIETQRVAAILLSIIVLVVLAEFVSAWARVRVARN